MSRFSQPSQMNSNQKKSLFPRVHLPDLVYNEDGSFNIDDGIFEAPESGIYLLSVHALPARGRSCRLQIHHNGIPVADISNGKKGTVLPQSQKKGVGPLQSHLLLTRENIRLKDGPFLQIDFNFNLFVHR